MPHGFTRPNPTTPKSIDALKWAVFDGYDDEAISREDQDWAMSRYEQFAYRKMFNLSKEAMMNEPIEDIAINLKLNHLVNRKQEMESDMMEEKAKRSK